ncbi:hypothetical protein [Loktanella sp. M215]|uniref:hypothetical protein n=1 Tax=Loktanella sp. M215 TaxID=2675431 RepID=UPI001F184D6C|nr:hypothetical protein [Loktanella sp. M215]MCF7700532.1 hypothetical protein [Loktanella sp. M215]
MSDLERNFAPVFLSEVGDVYGVLSLGTSQVTRRAIAARGRVSGSWSGSHPSIGTGGGDAHPRLRAAGFFDLSDLLRGARHV